jgi:hypothetical protein
LAGRRAVLAINITIANILRALSGHRGHCGKTAVKYFPFTNGFVSMGSNQYHEPPEELSPEARTFARMMQGLIEEAEAIDWYE